MSCVQLLLVWAGSSAGTAIPRRQLVRTVGMGAAAAFVSREPGTAFAAAPVKTDDVARIVAELDNKEIELRSVGQPWTRRLLRDEALDSSVPVEPELPAWLAGTWNVSAKYLTIALPIGRKGLGINIPGVRMASIIALPNVGAEPKGYLQRYARTADEAFNAKSSVEAYWIGSNVTVSAAKRGQLSLSIVPPVGGEIKQAQRVELMPVHAAWGYPNGATDDFVFEQVWKQKNVDAAFVTNYKILQRFTKLPDGNVLSRQKVVSFANPTDEQYMESEGKAVLTIFMEYFLERLPPR